MNQWKRAIETWFTGKEEQMVRQIADLVAVPSVGGESAGPCQPFGEGPAKALEVALLQAQAAGQRAENQGGYVLTADYVGSYIDYIIRHNMNKFKEVGFIGTDLHNVSID